MPFAGAGQGASLSGHGRSTARQSPAPEGPKPALPALPKPSAFGGQGRLLSGKPPREVIELD